MRLESLSISPQLEEISTNEDNLVPCSLHSANMTLKLNALKRWNWQTSVFHSSWQNEGRKKTSEENNTSEHPENISAVCSATGKMIYGLNKEASKQHPNTEVWWTEDHSLRTSSNYGGKI